MAKSSAELFSPTATSPYSSDDELHEARRMREDVEAGVLLMLAGTVRFQKPKNPESIWTAIAAAGKWMEILVDNTRSSTSKEAVADVIIALGQNEGVMKVWTGLIGAPPSRGAWSLFRYSKTGVFMDSLVLQICEGPLQRLLDNSPSCYQRKAT